MNNKLQLSKALTTGLLISLIISGCNDNTQTTEPASIQKPAESIVEIQVAQPTQADKGVQYYGLEQNLQRFSPLTQINDGNVQTLRPSWVLSLGDNRGQQTQPLIINGIMYATTHNATYAVDAKSGRQLWKTKIEYPPDTCLLYTSDAADE